MPVTTNPPPAATPPETPATGATVTRPCPSCGETEGEVIQTEGPWRLVTCASCGLAYLPEIPAPETLEEEFDWEASFRRERWERWLSNPLARFWTGALLLIKPNRERRAVRWIRRHAPSAGRLLDIGAGDGRLAAQAQRRGYDVTCVELSPAMAAKALRRLDREQVKVGRLADFAFPEHHFDVITAISYLEHEPEPLTLLGQVRGLLNPQGRLVIKVPNFDSLLRRVRGRRWAGFRWPEHVQYFTPETLTALLNRAGFKVAHVDANPLSDNFWVAASRS